MKVALAFALAVSASTVTLAAPSDAQACAMKRRPMKMVVAKKLMKDADAAAKKGEDRQAIRLYERAMNNGRDTAMRAQAAFAAAQLHQKAGKLNRAVSRMRRAHSFAPENPQFAVAYAQLALESGDAKVAQRALEKLLARSDLDEGLRTQALQIQTKAQSKLAKATHFDRVVAKATL